jgi:ligand-binding sensor domain-containing protein
MKFFLLAFITFYCCTVHVRGQGLHFTNINMDMGLPSNEAYRIVQDAKGYIWISTDAGLVRYNSKDFMLFNTERGMPSNNDIYALDADRHGRVWFATGGLKVGYILNDSVHVIPIGIEKEMVADPVGDLFYKIKFFEPDGTLLVSAHSYTFELSIKNGQWICKKVTLHQTNADYLLIEKKGGFKYAANLFNLLRVANQFKYKYPVKVCIAGKQPDSLFLNMPKRSIFLKDCFTAMLSDSSYILTVEDFLFIFNKHNQVKQQIKLPSLVHAIHVDQNDNIFVGCKKNGLFRLDNSNNFLVKARWLDAFSVSNIIEDKERGLWITTLENGIYYCSNSKLQTGSALLDSKNEIHFSKVVNGHLFLSDNNTPLTVIEKDTLLLSKQHFEGLNPHITDIVSSKGGYFISTTSGVYSFDKKFEKGRAIKLSNGRASAAKGIIDINGAFHAFDNTMLYLLEGKRISDAFGQEEQRINDLIYVGNNEFISAGKRGLIRYKKIVNDYTLKATQFSSYGRNINKIFKDAAGNFWLPAISDTLFVVDAKFNLKVAIPLGKKEINCRNITQLGKSSFLVSSTKGIIQVLIDSNYSKYQIKYFEKANGLPSNDIRNIVFFKGKYLVSTSHGLCFFNLPSDLEHAALPNTVIASCNRR